MQKYKYLIFDFDGTVNDTSEGIYFTFKRVLDIMGVSYEKVDFARHIGPPLEFSYTELVGEARRDEGIALHRKVYAECNALAKSRLYDGIRQTLCNLKDAGYTLAVASSKYEPHAVESIAMHGLSDVFQIVYGQNERRGYKTEVLRQLIAENGFEKSQCLMIGDTPYDIDGAHDNGIDAMAVTYGFGKIDELKNSRPELTAHTPREIEELIRRAEQSKR